MAFCGRSPLAVAATAWSSSTDASSVGTTSDGAVLLVCAIERRFWLSFCEVIERPDLPVDPRFATPADRAAHRPELVAELESTFAGRPLAHWLEALPKQKELFLLQHAFDAVLAASLAASLAG